MKTFKTIVTTMIVTILTIAIAFIVKFGFIDVDSHVDEYTTYKNGLLCEVSHNTEIDRVSLGINVNDNFTIFDR